MTSLWFVYASNWEQLMKSRWLVTAETQTQARELLSDEFARGWKIEFVNFICHTNDTVYREL